VLKKSNASTIMLFQIQHITNPSFFYYYISTKVYLLFSIQLLQHLLPMPYWMQWLKD